MTTPKNSHSYTEMIAILESQLKELKGNNRLLIIDQQVKYREDMIKHYKNVLEEANQTEQGIQYKGSYKLPKGFEVVNGGKWVKDEVKSDKPKTYRANFTYSQKLPNFTSENPFEGMFDSQTEELHKQIHTPLKEMENSAKEIKTEKRELLVIDINYLLPEYKSENLDDLQELLEEKYNRDILLIDSSKVNIQGSISNGRAAYIV